MITVAGIMLLLVAGGTGAVARYLVGLLIPVRVIALFPWATLAVNVSGAFLLGLATELATQHLLPMEWRSVIGTAFLGGYTTFSTASLDVWNLIARGKGSHAAAYALTMFVGAIVAAMAGIWIAAQSSPV